MEALLALSTQQRSAAHEENQSQHTGGVSVQSQEFAFSKMHAGEDPEAFLLRLESATTPSSLTKEEWAMHLASLLSGDAQACYQALPYSTAEGYDQLTDALLNRTDVSEEHCRKIFRSLTFSAGGKPRSVAHALRNLARKWLKPDVRSSEEIVELIIVEQFIQILPAEAESWLRHQQTSSLDSIIQAIEEYMLGKNQCKLSKDPSEEARRTTLEQDALFKGSVPVKLEIDEMIDEVEPSLLLFPKTVDVKREPPSATDHQDTGDAERPEVCPADQEMWREYDRTLEELLQTKSVSIQIKKEETAAPEENEICRSPMTTPALTTMPVENGDDTGNLLPPPFSAYGATVSNSNTLKVEEKHPVENRYTCAECGKSFNANPHSSEAKVTYHMEEPYKCTECKSKLNHSLHQIVEHQIKVNEGQYVCEECGRGFYGCANLAIHKREHAGERPFACGKCGMTFSQQSDLVQHQKMKAYSCTECGKSFRRAFHLTRHQLTHTGEKPYKCVHCGKSFNILSNMLAHQKRKICYLHKGKTGLPACQCSRCTLKKTKSI